MSIKKNKIFQRIFAILLCFMLAIGNLGVLEIVQSVKAFQSEESDSLVNQDQGENSDGINQPQEFSTLEELNGNPTINETPLVNQEEEDLQSIEVKKSPYLYLNPLGEDSKNGLDGYFVGGNDAADGLTAETPVKTLEVALEKSKELKVELNEIITIVVMNPIEIKEKEVKTYDGLGNHLTSWEGRADKNEVIFKLLGGTLNLSHFELNKLTTEEKTNLISINEGSLEINEKLTVNGTICLNFLENKNKENLPLIKIVKPLDLETYYGIDIKSTEELKSQKAIEGIYPEGEMGEAFINHFSLIGEGLDNINLKVSEEKEDGKTILVGKIEKPLLKSPRAAGSNAVVYWNVNPDTFTPEGDVISVPGGSDYNSGLSDQYPVLTWEKAKEILGGSGGTVIVMSPVVIGDAEFSDAGGNPITVLDGENKIALTQWQVYPGDVFIVPPGETFTLKNIDINCYEGVAIRIADPSASGVVQQLGKLVIGENTHIINGYIQTELNPYNPNRLNDCTIELLPTANAGAGAYGVYFSGINDNEVFNFSDVIATPAGTNADDYLNWFVLNAKNTDEGWLMRKDNVEDGSAAIENHIEIYREFIYKGIYLNGQQGDDSWFGGNCNWPVKTFEQAKKILFDNWDKMAPEDRVIYLCDTVDVTGQETWNFIDTDGSNTIVDGTDLSGQTKVVCCKTHSEWTMRHTVVPTTLVSVKEGGELTTSALTMVYDSNNVNNIMIDVQPGGAYTSQTGTTLTGYNTMYAGTGVNVKGAVGKTTTFNMDGGTITLKKLGVSIQTGGSNTVFNFTGGKITKNSRQNQGGYGSGVYVNNAIFNMTGGEISFNESKTPSSTGYGAGVYVEGLSSVFSMSAGKISKNKDIYNSVYSESRGSGVYIAQGKFNLSGTGEISENTLYSGNGAGVYIAQGAEMNMDGGNIEKNTISQYYYYSPFGGGGICSEGKLTITDGSIKGNRVESNGYGNYSNYRSHGGGIFMRNTGAKLYITGGTIEGNFSGYFGGGIAFYNVGGTAVNPAGKITDGTINENTSSFGGGGIYTQGVVEINNGLVDTNTSVSYGGGVYNDGTLTVEGTKIIKNIVQSCGAGFYNNGTLNINHGIITSNVSQNYGGGIGNVNIVTIKDTSIKLNTAANGGGIFNAGTGHVVNTEVSENTASGNGGGFYNNGGTLVIASGTFSQNSGINGSTGYFGGTGNSYLLGGTYDAELTSQEAYGIYVDINSTSSAKTYVNPSNITLTDRVFINTAPSKLYLLETVPTVPNPGSENILPVSVNTEEFKVGSVVVSPGNISSVTVAGATYNFNRVTDVEPYVAYFSGGKIPPKTQLGGFNKNIILVGEGVYLDGTSKGNDSNGGTSPSDAVKTYKRAKEILTKKINDAKAAAILPVDNIAYDPDGFEPFIYVCGQVDTPVDGDDQLWTLDYEDPIYVQSTTVNTEGNIINTNSAKIVRFASYYGTIVNVSGGDPFTLGKLIMDGNSGATDGANNSIATMINVSTGNKLIVENAILQNNYSNGITNSGGAVTLKGSDTGDGSDGALIKDHGNWGVDLSNGGTLTMSANSGIESGGTTIPGYQYGAGSIRVIGNNSKVTMLNTSYAKSLNRYGIFVAGGRSGIGISETPSVEMRDQSTVKDSSIGIYMTGVNSVVTLKEEASILGSTGTGVFVTSASNGSRLNMEDNTQIANGYGNGTYGLRVQSNTSTLSPYDNFKANLSGNAKIVKNNYGVYLDSYAYYTEINLTGNSKIGENTNYGIYAVEGLEIGSKAVSAINIKGNAVVGDASNQALGNGANGIYARGKIEINLEENGKIANNRNSGIYSYKGGSSTSYGGATVKMKDSASIENNLGCGVEGYDYSKNYQNTMTITLAGGASIRNNTGIGVKLSEGGTLNLGDGTSILNNSTSNPNGIGNAIDALGKINLGGSANVDGEIYLRTVEKPITLTSPGVNQFNVGCSDNFIGQVLVMPDGTNITQADPYLGNFVKTTHFPLEKSIVVRTPNLIVEGENNVYLAGPGTGAAVPGNDSNNGGSIGSPVATFERAVSILKTLKPGANIIICNYAVTPLSSQNATWSFDPNGTVTNASGETWTPLVLRHESFTGDMIYLNYSGRTFTLRNIIIDGNKDKFPNGTAGAAIQNYYNSNLILEEGGVVQNNRKGSTASGILNYGTVKINGGSIKGNEIIGTGDYYGAGIYNAGTLIMNSGSIKGNINKNTRGASNWYSWGGGIYTQGITELNGGEISENVAIGASSRGSAIYVAGGTTTISGGTQITGNVVDSDNYYYGYAQGTIYVQGGTLTMTGGDVKNNKVINRSLYSSTGFQAQGGGIYNNSGTVNLSGVAIENNQCIDVNRVETSTNSYTQGGGIYTVGGFLQFLSGSIRNNAATSGAAIYYGGGKIELAGGIIEGNKPQNPDFAPSGINAPIFVGAADFKLKGGGCEITDRLYLANVNGPITLAGSIYQRNRLYNIDCGPGYTKGSIVVKPDNDVIINATSFLRYFNAPKAGYVLEKESPNLVLKQCIYIDSESGSDSNNGNTPSDAVASMARAKAIGGNGDYVIYASGPVYVNGTETWSLPTNAWLCRYTGFPVTGSTTRWGAYTGPLVITDSGDQLNISSMKIYGRREIDTTIEGDSLIFVGEGSKVTMGDKTELLLNNTPVGSHGGGVNIDGGTFELNGGSIAQTVAGLGSAIYQNGVLSIANTSSVLGEVYLAGTGSEDSTSKHILAQSSYVPATGTKLNINAANAFATRHIVEYPTGVVPNTGTKEYFSLNPSIAAVYRLGNRSSENNVLELQEKGVVYIDGVAGLDTNSGNTPVEAVLTLEKAYELLKAGKEGGLILVVNQVTINDNISLNNTVDGTGEHGYYRNGGTTIDAEGPVYIQRYAQPTAWESLSNSDKYIVTNYTGVLFEIGSSGTMTVDNIAFDGHSQEVVGNPIFASLGVEAEAPLFRVIGTLKANADSIFYKNKNVATDGKSAGIYIDGGTFNSMDTTILDVEAPNGKGSAIYQDGTCILNRAPKIVGDIHLTGNGNTSDQSSSKYIEIQLRGFQPASGTLSITMDDPYLRRPVVKYPGDAPPFQPNLTDIKLFRLEESVTDLYALGSRVGQSNILELQYRHRVYIDGVSGLDTNIGDTPITAVRTLEKAYTRLQEMGGGYLYVVNKVTINDDMTLSDTKYMAGTKTINVEGGTVEIRRYVVPDAQSSNPYFARPTFTGSLFEIAPGKTVDLGKIIMDGHKEIIANGDPFEDVATTTKANAPLISVLPGGNLNINSGAVLRNNDNTLEAANSLDGGAISNAGTVHFDGGQLTGNAAKKGAGIYQKGVFIIDYGTSGLIGQEIYLTATNNGTAENPVWIAERVIHQKEYVEDTIKLDINVDNPVKGRNITIYDNDTAYSPTVDAMYNRYRLGSTITSVNPKLFLVESATETNTLELQNYEVLDISIPVEVFLVMVESPLNSVANNPNARNSQMQAPNYKIKNNGDYDVKVTLDGFNNNNASDGITWDPMTLVNNPSDLVSPGEESKLYLAVAGSNAEAGNKFNALEEKTLQTTPIPMGILGSGEQGEFTFRGEATAEFFEKYKDTHFYSNMSNVDTYIKNNARAKYQMVYKFELVR
ncbi:MAG: hypothetical protein ACRCU3_09320 [Eubacteriaceae bacterium]